MLLSAILTAALLVEVPAPVPESGSISGEVEIEAFAFGGVMVYVDTNRDDSFDHVFRLRVPDPRKQQDLDASTKIGREPGDWGTETTLNAGSIYGHANVEFGPGYVRVLFHEDAYEFFVKGTQRPQWNPDGVKVLHRAGLALTHEVRESGIPVSRVGKKTTITEELCKCDPYLGGVWAPTP
jgi:hypothetical protein